MKSLIVLLILAIASNGLPPSGASSQVTVRFRPPSSLEVFTHLQIGAVNTCMVLLVNSQLIAHCPCGSSEQTGCIVELPVGFSGGGRDALLVAVYVAENDNLRLIDVIDGDRLQTANTDNDPSKQLRSAAANEMRRAIARPAKNRPRVLIYNTVENTPGTQKVVQIFNTTGSFTSVEEIVQSAGKITCSDQHGTCGIYHATPQIGGHPVYYCWWRKRNSTASNRFELRHDRTQARRQLHDTTNVSLGDSEETVWLGPNNFWETKFMHGNDLPPDCANISANARYFANLWHKTGVDVIVPDTTNLNQDDAMGDLLNMRPVEVLAEELVSLRSQGVATPQLAVWTIAAKNTSMYKGMLRTVLNKPAFSDLLLREPSKHKAIYFVHSDSGESPADPEVVAAIESNGGANNISVIEMWANASPDRAADGLWTFFQPCENNEMDSFTTTVLNDPHYQCNHLKSAGKAGGIGSQMSAAMSWQSHAASLAWASPSKLMGLTFQAMIDDVLREKPDNILLPSFDEWGATPMAYGKVYWQAQYTVGFPPSEQHVMFVDTFGAERSRTWAPSMEAGDFYLRLTQSCLRVVALAAESGARNCSVSGEMCCNRTVAQFTRIFSLQNMKNTDFLPSKDISEVQNLVKSGNYKQICTSSLGGYGSDYFCFTRAEEDFSAHMGPFMLYSLAQVPAKTDASLLHQAPRAALYRCRATGGTGNEGHFISASSQCDGDGVMDSLLGYASTQPHTGMPRLLRRCVRTSDSVRYHTLDALCLSNDTSTSLGYVF